MKKTIFGLLLFAALIASPAWAADNTANVPGEEKAGMVADPVEQFTGKYWMNSTSANKEAYLFGIESAIAVNYQLEKRLAEKSGKSRKGAYLLSKFDRSWIEAFKSTPRKDIVAAVDKWYTDHPDKLDRPVLNTIWYELIAPRIDAKK